jgi:ATP-dependent exoDNAse (exonuclease V) alpha subunit
VNTIINPNTSTTDTSNTAFKLAADFVQYTHAAIFLTGKAGTGKTTFLKYCKENEKKNTAIVAPTGVAAINAGGVTIHSFFQLPFTPYIPESAGYGNTNIATDKHSLIGKLKLTNERKEVIQQLDLLIIDEVSMVRCDVIDAIDIVLRHVRNNYQQSFGGVQVLFIGDMYQLPPVAKEEEWQLLQQYYKSPYFFSSHVIEKNPPVYVALDKIYRQKDEQFVELLNQVRNNMLTEKAAAFLHTCYKPDFKPNKEEGYITLTTHNHKADTINTKALQSLSGASFYFKAQINGDFNEKAYPAEVELLLKLGAQVMFIKNDVEKVRRYFNGKIGKVTRLEEDKIFVQCNGDTNSIEVKKESWKNIKYAVDKNTNKIDETELGSFNQYPLRLAWAITIHKSQGLTFEKAIIDAGDAFAPGQVYVALSRCTTMQGMVLHSKINNRSLINDEKIATFSAQQKTNEEQLHILHQAKRDYQQQEILQLFQFAPLVQQAQQITPTFTTHINAFNKNGLVWILDVQKLIEQEAAIADKFLPQLQQLMASTLLPENNTPLQARIVAASKHFSSTISALTQLIINCPLITDSKTIALEINKLINDWYKAIYQKLQLLQHTQHGFEIDNFLQHKREINKPGFNVNVYAGKNINLTTDSPHPLLHQQLKTQRDAICTEKNLPIYLVLNTKAIDDMAMYLPQTYDELKQIGGFGTAKVKQYGEIFLSIINQYCEENNLLSNMELLPPKAKKKEKEKIEKIIALKKPNTKDESYRLYQSGITISQIAMVRNMAISTIEGHLAYFIENGKLDVNNFVSEEKQTLIKNAMEQNGTEYFKTIVEVCKQQVTYGEVRMVAASLKNKPTDVA